MVFDLPTAAVFSQQEIACGTIIEAFIMSYGIRRDRCFSQTASLVVILIQYFATIGQFPEDQPVRAEVEYVSAPGRISDNEAAVILLLVINDKLFEDRCRDQFKADILVFNT